LSLVAPAGCKLPGTTGRDSTAVYTPSWITAEWNLGSGPPALRFDRDAVLHFDATCPAFSFSFRISAAHDSLSVFNHCDRSATIYVCATSGDPGNTLPVCASDPLETSLASMIVATVSAGAAADVGSPVENLQLEFFYCGDQSTMLFLPLRCGP
jgi:hypothetical protein